MKDTSFVLRSLHWRQMRRFRFSPESRRRQLSKLTNSDADMKTDFFVGSIAIQIYCFTRYSPN
jgi:hypothetical protein